MSLFMAGGVWTRWSLRSLPTLIILLFYDSVVWFWTCSDECSRSLAAHLAGIFIYFQCTHIHRVHTHSGPQQVKWIGICHCFLPLHEQWNCSAEGATLLLWSALGVTGRQNLFLYCIRCHSGLYLCCSEAPCTRLSVEVIPNLIQINGKFCLLGSSVVLSNCVC